MKRLGVLIATAAIVATAVPTVAGAAAVTSSPEKLAPVGSSLTLTGSYIEIQSSILDDVICNKLNFTTRLTKNDGSTFEATRANAKPDKAECVDKNYKTATVTSLEVGRLIASSAADSLTFKMTMDFSPGFECTLTGTNVPFSYIKGSHQIRFNFAHGIVGQPKNSCGEFYIEGEFLTEIGTTPVILD